MLSLKDLLKKNQERRLNRRLGNWCLIFAVASTSCECCNENVEEDDPEFDEPRGGGGDCNVEDDDDEDYEERGCDEELEPSFDVVGSIAGEWKTSPKDPGFQKVISFDIENRLRVINDGDLRYFGCDPGDYPLVVGATTVEVINEACSGSYETVRTLEGSTLRPDYIYLDYEGGYQVLIEFKDYRTLHYDGNVYYRSVPDTEPETPSNTQTPNPEDDGDGGRDDEGGSEASGSESETGESGTDESGGSEDSGDTGESESGGEESSSSSESGTESEGA